MNPYDFKAQAVRLKVLEMLYQSQASHLGSNMSVIEILCAIYESVDIEKIKLQSPDRSRVLISKGHSAAATYATLFEYGLLQEEILNSYHKEGSYLTGHVSHYVDGVEHSTGALGHGINVAVGCAIAQKSLHHRNCRTYAVLGDGELQEGSVWEALMLACHKKLSNLVILVDKNGISSITKTDDVIDMNPLRQRFEGFGANVVEVNGHCISDIITAINSIKNNKSPNVVICETIKGYNVPFAENDPMWHYKTLSKSNYEDAVGYLNGLGGSV